MRKCENCGALVAEDDRFCGNCGYQVTYKTHQQVEIVYRPKGVILTDSLRLAHKLNISQTTVLSLLQEYIIKISSRISYSLLDTFQKPSNDWRAYHQVLFENKYLSFRDKMEYLFIIGAEDIIPVPHMRNCMVTNRTEMVPTDILYGYNFSFFTQNVEDVNILLQSKQLYHVGRLPLGTDASIAHLQNYLERSASYCDTGVPVQLAYGQCDPHWKLVSADVVSALKKSELFPNIEAPSSVIYDKLFLSPYITCNTIDKAFNKYSNLYYFNMHGSGNPEKPYFLGASLEDEEMYPGMDPDTISSAKYDNIVITEACYGGKFMNLATDRSMLLSSLSNSTMLYLGSSVVAYGTVDAGYRNGTKIGSADIMAKGFISYLMKGYSAGDAVYKTRQKLIESSRGSMAASNLLTVYEFSLYGDPSLKAKFPNQKCEAEQSHDVISNEINTNSYHIEEVYSEQPQSILAMVRKRVDSSLQSLNQEIQKQLSDMGIKPRLLESISKVRYGLSSQHMFSYKTETGEDSIVIVDDRDHSKTVLMPKGSIEQNFEDARRLTIDYASIFRNYSQRFGFIQNNEDDQPVLSGNGARLKTVYIDKRIEPRSKRQIRTFNAVLDQVYRPEMRNGNIASLATKDCDYDFSLLINPLGILLETELRLGMKTLIKKEGSGWPSDPTFGRLADCLRQNEKLLLKYGINGDFLSWISDVPEYRNPASHRGGTNESKFLDFYDLFIKIVSSPYFSKVLELKQNYK